MLSDSDKQAIAEGDRKVRRDLASLVGKKIVRADYNKKDEGVFTLYFEDGSAASFSSTGDDATYTTLWVEVPR